MRILNNPAFRIIGATCLVLLVPLIAMQFSDQVNWTASDFVVAAILLLAAGAVYEALARRMRESKQRAIVGVSVLVVLAAVWVQLAAGILD